MKLPRPLRRLSLFFPLLFLHSTCLFADTLYWDTATGGGITTGSGTWDFNNTSAWSASTAGSNPLLKWTDNANTAAFIVPAGNATVTINDSNGPVGANGLLFSGVGGGGTLSLIPSGVSALTLGTGGINATFTNQVVSISAPIVLGGSQTWSSSSLRSNNNGPSMRIAGSISSGSGVTNLTFDGRGVSNAVAQGNTAMRAAYGLYGSNTFTGKTTIVGGAAVVLDYTTNTGSKLDDGSPLVLAGGSVVMNGGTAVSEVVGSTLVAAGANSIYKGSGSAGTTFNNIQLGGITHSGTGTFDITNAVAQLAFTTTQNTNGILGGWATVAGGSWAVGSSDGSSTTITGTSGTTRNNASASWGATENVNDTTGTGITENIVGGKTINALRIANSGVTLSFDGSLLTLNSGGIIAANTGQSIVGGSITSGGADGNLYVHTPNAFTIGSQIVNNGSTAVKLVKAGTSSLTLTGANTYTGGTVINSGTLSVAATGSIVGSVLVHGGATFDVTANGGHTVASGDSLAGGGSVLGNVTVASGGHLAPSYSYTDDQSIMQSVTGTLSLGANLTLNNGSIMDLGLGDNSSLINLTSVTAILTGSDAAGITLNIFDAGGLIVGNTYTIMQWQAGTTLTDFDLTDFSLNGVTGNLQFGTNSLQLTVTSIVPEPGTWAMLFAGIAFTLLLQRAKYRRAINA